MSIWPACTCCGGENTSFAEGACIFCKPLPPTEEWPYFHCDPAFTGHIGAEGPQATSEEIANKVLRPMNWPAEDRAMRALELAEYIKQFPDRTIQVMTRDAVLFVVGADLDQFSDEGPTIVLRLEEDE